MAFFVMVSISLGGGGDGDWYCEIEVAEDW